MRNIDIISTISGWAVVDSSNIIDSGSVLSGTSKKVDGTQPAFTVQVGIANAPSFNIPLLKPDNIGIIKNVETSGETGKA